MRVIRGLLVLGMVAVVGMAALLGLLWLDHGRETVLPTPTGGFAVGRTMAVWRDATQVDRLAPKPGTPRELVAWMWYPAAAPAGSQGAVRAEYVPGAWGAAFARQRGVLLAEFLTRDLARVRTHSVTDAAVSPAQATDPVVLLRAGLAAATVSYTALAEEMASHGYVVVGFDAPYRSGVVVFPDGRVVACAPQNDADRVDGAEQERLATRLVGAWDEDMGFALDELRLNAAGLSDRAGDRFAGRLDLGRVGMVGHSLGGATALAFCHEDARCTAGVDVDGAPLGSVVETGVRQPFLFVLSEYGGGGSDAETRQVLAHMRSIYDRLPPNGRAWIVIRGANHFGFSDDAAMLKSPLLMRLLRAIGVVRLDGRRQMAVTGHAVCGFLDVQVKGAPGATTREAAWPEMVAGP